ncbi:hypothetical protein ACV22V_22990 [Burkholderia sp. AW33-5]
MLACLRADVVPAPARLILVEGNYLLLDDAPWDVLHASFDVTVMLDGNDLVNLDMELSRSVRADLSVGNG